MPVMWKSTAPASPLSLPIFFTEGVAPLASVYFTLVPLGKTPKRFPSVSCRVHVGADVGADEVEAPSSFMPPFRA